MSKLTKKQIEKAMSWKCCPFCQGKDFRATIELTGRNFIADARDGITWAEREKEKIFCVQCNTCLEDIPEEVWGKWGLEG